MWHEIDFVASANIRTYVQFYLFETQRGGQGYRERRRRRPATKTSPPRSASSKVAESYLAEAEPARTRWRSRPIEEHFKWVNDGIRWVETARLEAEPSHLEALLEFAARAYRRPLSPAERDDLLAYYRSLREKDGLSHEDAMRDSVVTVLMSPDFCYRVDPASKPDARDSRRSRTTRWPAG